MPTEFCVAPLEKRFTTILSAAAARSGASVRIAPASAAAPNAMMGHALTLIFLGARASHAPLWKWRIDGGAAWSRSGPPARASSGGEGAYASFAPSRQAGRTLVYVKRRLLIDLASAFTDAKSSSRHGCIRFTGTAYGAAARGTSS